LTTMRLPNEQIGSQAARTLLEMIDHPTTDATTTQDISRFDDWELIVRESTGPVTK